MLSQHCVIFLARNICPHFNLPALFSLVLSHSYSPSLVGLGRPTHWCSGLHCPKPWIPLNTMWLQLSHKIPSQSDSFIFLACHADGLAFAASSIPTLEKYRCFVVDLICLIFAAILNYISLRYRNCISCLSLFITFILNWWYIYFGNNSLFRKKFFHLYDLTQTLDLVQPGHSGLWKQYLLVHILIHVFDILIYFVSRSLINTIRNAYVFKSIAFYWHSLCLCS